MVSQVHNKRFFWGCSRIKRLTKRDDEDYKLNGKKKKKKRRNDMEWDKREREGRGCIVCVSVWMDIRLLCKWAL